MFASPAPPSAPVSLSWEYKSLEEGVTLRWKAPPDLGGRSEVTYAVVCRICPSATQIHPGACSWCGDSVTYMPSKSGLIQTKITLSNLLTRVTYLIQVHRLHYISPQLTQQQSKYICVYICIYIRTYIIYIIFFSRNTLIGIDYYYDC